MKEIHFDESAICPVANICEATTEGAPPCGTSADHLLPLGLAEELCQRAVVGRMHHERQPIPDDEMYIRVRTEAERDLRLAWLRLERAMPKYVERAGALDCFDDAIVYADRVIRSAPSFETWHSAALLRDCLPMFKTRRFPDERRSAQELTAEHLRLGTLAVGKLGRAAQEAPIHTHVTHPNHLTRPDHTPCFGSEVNRIVHLKKTGCMLLALRAGLKIFPASLRESAIISHRAKIPSTRFSHDYYTITSSSQKLPVKTKSRSHQRYSAVRASVLFVPYDELSNKAVRSRKDRILRAGLVAPEEYALQDFPLKTVSWLIDEALGKPAEGIQDEILGAMSLKLLNNMAAFAAYLEGPET